MQRMKAAEDLFRRMRILLSQYGRGAATRLEVQAFVDSWPEGFDTAHPEACESFKLKFGQATVKREQGGDDLSLE